MELAFRKWTADDAADFYRLACTPNIQIWMNPDFPRTPEECRGLLETFAASEDQTFFCRALLVDGQAAGSLGLFPGDGGRGKVAYWLGENYWRQGIMSAALSAFCALGFERYGLSTITAEPRRDNLPSQKTLLKVGFQPPLEPSGCSFVLEPKNLRKY